MKQTEEEKLGSRIRDLRLRRQMSQEQLAEPMYTAAYISHVEKGKRRASHEAMTHIAERLGMTFDQLTTGRDPDEDLRLEVEIQKAIATIHAGSPDEVIDSLRSVSRRASKNANRRAAVDAEVAIGLAHYQAGRLDESRGTYEKVLEVLEGAPPERRTSALVGVGRCMFHAGEARDAVHLLEGHLVELQRSGSPDPGCLVETYSALIPPYFETGLIERAKDVAAAGWKLAQRVGDLQARGCLYVNRAQLMLTQGEPREALTSLALAEDVYRHLGWQSEAVKVKLAKSFVLTDQEEFQAAENLILDALGEPDASIAAVDEVRALTRLALIARKTGRAEEGLRYANKAIKAAGTAFQSSAAEARREAGLCALELGDERSALTFWRRALKDFMASSDHEEVALTASLLSDHLLETGNKDEALRVLRSAVNSVGELH